jgi:glycosyltransferase involved in cell wall biosynthesis
MWGGKDVIRDRYNGILIPPRDINALSHAIESLILDKKKLKMLSKNIKDFKKSFVEFSWSKIVQKYIHLKKSIN